MVRRRSIAVVAAAGLALAGLAGCRVEPGTAAFVGGDRISDARVDKIVSEVQAYVQSGQTGDVRQNVLTWLVMADAGKQYAAAHHVTIKPMDTATFAQQANLPAGTENSQYAKAGAEYDAVLIALAPIATSTAPSEPDQREAYENAGQAGHGEPFASVKQYFNEQTMGQAVGLRNLLTDVMKSAHVSISPRYGSPHVQVPFTIGSVQTYLGVPLEATPASPAVVDAR
jgi:hypothetical protein